MRTLDVLFHGLNFVAPAAFLALGLAVCARICLGTVSVRLAWWKITGLNFAAGCAVLLLGVALGAHDGLMLTYATLALVMGTVQWWWLLPLPSGSTSQHN